MQVPARLKWRREGEGFVAYPLGFIHRDRFAAVQFLGNMALGNEHFVPRWRWAVQWPGWFSVQGHDGDKQRCADKATEAWWQAIVTPMPRDVATEIDMIVARILVRPPPNSLIVEDSDYLRRLIQALRLQYEEEMRSETLPEPVRNLMASLSAELFRRRQAGEAEESPNRWSVT